MTWRRAAWFEWIWIIFLCSVCDPVDLKKDLHFIYKCEKITFILVTGNVFIDLQPQAFIYLVIHEVKTV